MMKLWRAESNAMNFIIMENMEDDTAIIVDYDLSDDEIEAITQKFIAKGYQLDDSDIVAADEIKWEDSETVFAGLFAREVLA